MFLVVRIGNLAFGYDGERLEIVILCSNPTAAEKQKNPILAAAKRRAQRRAKQGNKRCPKS